MDRRSPKRRLSIDESLEDDSSSDALDNQSSMQFNFSAKGGLNGSSQKIYHKFTAQGEGEETRDVKKSTIW